MHRSALLRILDANANRAGEALRVVEEYLRFVLEDRYLGGELKQLRHDLAAALAPLPRDARLAARDTAGDPGTQLQAEAELRRADPAAVAAANLRRLAEALRALEEYGKILDPLLAARFEALRYRGYTLEKAIGACVRGGERLRHARLYVLLDCGANETAFEQAVAEAISAGAGAIQLRDKRPTDRELLARARRLRELTADSAALFIMNDRPDLALLARADGVHVGQEELPVAAVRAVVGPDMLIGVSTHSLPQARQAVLEGADYLGCGPCFPSRTKEFAEFPGIPFLREAAGEIGLPAYAIGGITGANLEEVLAAGFTRVAVSGGPAKSAEELAALAARLSRSAE